MWSVGECYSKVKKDCFKFIKSQETPTEKFGNKDVMLKTFLIPMCFWIAKKQIIKKPRSSNKINKNQTTKKEEGQKEKKEKRKENKERFCFRERYIN